MLEIIRQIANKAVKQKYPTLGDNRYTMFDVMIIIQSYLAVLEYQQKEVQKD